MVSNLTASQAVAASTRMLTEERQTLEHINDTLRDMAPRIERAVSLANWVNAYAPTLAAVLDARAEHDPDARKAVERLRFFFRPEELA